MGLTILTTLIGKLFGLGKDWVEAKYKQETAKVENKIALEKAKTQAKITIAQKDADASNNVDLMTIRNQRHTWTDEYIKVVFTLPFILMFLPWTQEYVASGFEAFKTYTPDWYKYVIYAIVVSELGMRRVFMKLFDMIGGKK